MSKKFLACCAHRIGVSTLLPSPSVECCICHCRTVAVLRYVKS